MICYGFVLSWNSRDYYYFVSLVCLYSINILLLTFGYLYRTILENITTTFKIQPKNIRFITRLCYY